MRQGNHRHWTHGAALCGIGALTLGTLASPAFAQAQAQAQTAPEATQQVRKATAVFDLQSTISQTAAVVEGTVSDISHEYSEEDGPWTRVTLSNLKTHLGAAPASLEIRHFGGPLPNGRAVVAAELPVYEQGKRYVVFLRNTSWNLSPVVGDLALRVEKVDGAEVLVNSDGQAVTGVGKGGVEMGPALFEGPQFDGGPAKALGRKLATLVRQPLDRQGLVQALKASLASSGMSVAGSFRDHPAGEFKWHAISTSPSPGFKPATATASTPTEQKTARAAPEVDTSRPMAK